MEYSILTPYGDIPELCLQMKGSYFVILKLCTLFENDQSGNLIVLLASKLDNLEGMKL